MQADNRTNALSGHLETQMAFFVGGGGAVLGIAPGEPALVMPGEETGQLQTHSRRLPAYGQQRRGTNGIRSGRAAADGEELRSFGPGGHLVLRRSCARGNPDRPGAL